ncbi:MAG TPA: Ig-like domain-containing protein, partial [Verrucomicrobiae bacterium]
MKRIVCSLAIGLLSTFAIWAVPPSIGIRSPVTNANFFAAPALKILASGSDPDGFIAKVEYYRGATKLGQVTNNLASVTNFLFTWTNPPTGASALTAVATDNGGSATTSSIVNVTINGLAANAANVSPAESVWKYLDNGTDQSTAWRATVFNDSA